MDNRKISNSNKSFLKVAILLIAIAGVFFLLPSMAAKDKKETIGQSSVREEIQRYMGYEPLLQRYLSLPYDTSINSNVSGAFVDISFLVLALLPILFLFGFRTKPLLGISTMFLFALVFLISISNGSLFTQMGTVGIEQFKTLESNLKQESIISKAYQNIAFITQPLNRLIGNFSSNQDHVTYPIMILLFISGFFVLRNRISDLSIKTKSLILFTFFFSFLWVLLTAGIVWYGYPIIAISILLIFSGLFKKRPETDLFQKSASALGLGVLGVFIFVSTIYRFSNYQTYTNPQLSKLMFDLGEINYQSGKSNTKQVFDGFFPGGGWEAIQQINQEEKSLVYRVGTVFPYFIEKNDERVLLDNQLGIFYQLNKRYPKKELLASVLKANGYKYILVDLNTHTIDKTPERTLENKFKDFMNFCIQNQNLKLLATNRMIDASNDPQKPQYAYRVYGNIVPNKQGTYAIYEII